MIGVIQRAATCARSRSVVFFHAGPYVVNHSVTHSRSSIPVGASSSRRSSLTGSEWGTRCFGLVFLTCESNAAASLCVGKLLLRCLPAWSR